MNPGAFIAKLSGHRPWSQSGDLKAHMMPARLPMCHRFAPTSWAIVTPSPVLNMAPNGTVEGSSR